MFDAANPLIQHYVNKIPAADLGKSTQGLFTSLRFLGVSQTIISTAKGLLDDGVAVVLAAAFVFTPFAVANVGVIIIALLLPAYKSAKLVAGPGKLHKENTTSTSAIQTWLQYWLCLGLLLLLRDYNMATLYPSAMMALTLWLQNSHFQGASTAIRHTVGFVQELLSYEKEQKRKRAARKMAEEEAVSADRMRGSGGEEEVGSPVSAPHLRAEDEGERGGGEGTSSAITEAHTKCASVAGEEEEGELQSTVSTRRVEEKTVPREEGCESRQAQSGGVEEE